MKKDLLINSSGLVLNILERIFNANIVIKGIENIPQNNPRIFVANHFTRMEAMIVPYALYDITDKKVGVIADDGLFSTYFGNFLNEIGAMKKSEPCRNNIIIGDLLTGHKDWLIFPEGRMVKSKDISRQGNHYCVKVDGICQRVYTGSSFFALSSQLLRNDFFSNKVKHFKKFKRKHFLKSKNDVNKHETKIIPINITYSNIRKGENFLTNLALKFLDNIGDNYLEELELEGNMALNSKITINILKPISTQSILNTLHTKELNHTKLINKVRYDITHEFMTTIYENLTINFDHLFVLTLFLYPKKSIKENHFKRLLYLIAKAIQKENINFDEDINNKLINLISYETYEAYENVLQVAQNDKVIDINEEEIFISKNSLLNSYTHHTIRLNNILRVILNEVLIIDTIKNLVKNFVNLNEEQVNKKLFSLLKQEEEVELIEDRLDLINEKLQKREIGKSFSLSHENSNTCVIVVHGFCSAPKEVEELSNYLYQEGFDILAPRLRGHGTNAKDLVNRTWQDWYLSLSRSIAMASLKYKNVYLIGFSTGGLLALLSSKKNYMLKGIVCINAALHLKDIRIKTILPAISFWNDLVNSFNAKNLAKEYVENSSENPEVNYDRHYIKAIEELNLLMNKTKKHIPKIDTKTFIIQAKDDPVVNPISAYEIYDNIKSKNKKILMLDLNRHIIIKGDDTKKLFFNIRNFLS